MVQEFDNMAFENLFESVFNDLLGYVMSYVKDRELARDIVHDAFLALWNNRETVDLSRGARPFVFSIAQHIALNYIRHQQIVSLKQPEIIRLFYATELVKEEYDSRILRVKQKMKELSPKQQEIVILCITEGKKYKEVAEELNISVNTVKTHLARALKYLRDELKDDLLLLVIWKREKNS